MRVRRAAPRDAEAIGRVAARSHRAAYEPIVDDETLIEGVERPDFAADLRTWLHTIRDREDVVYLVCERRLPPGRFVIVGFAIFTSDDGMTAEYVVVDDGSALLQSLYVDPDHWGDGIGSQLLAAGVESLPPTVDRLKLGVHRDNERAREFYTSRGFEKVSETTYELEGASYPTDILACDIAALELPVTGSPSLSLDPARPEQFSSGS